MAKDDKCGQVVVRELLPSQDRLPMDVVRGYVIAGDVGGCKFVLAFSQKV